MTTKIMAFILYNCMVVAFYQAAMRFQTHSQLDAERFEVAALFCLVSLSALVLFRVLDFLCEEK